MTPTSCTRGWTGGLWSAASGVEAALGRRGGPLAAELLPYDMAARELPGVGPGAADTGKSYLGGIGPATTVGNSVSLDLAARRVPLGAEGAPGEPPGAPTSYDGLLCTCSCT